MNRPRPLSPSPLAPTAWSFPAASEADRHGLVGVGADLEPETLIHAYRSGFFPMPADEDDVIAWWSPDPRGILELDDLHVSRSLLRSCRRFRVTVDREFEEVIRGCADTPRPGGWISPAIVGAYVELHRLRWAHSVEVWDDGNLVGGIYGVQVAGLFAGESMFRRETDASKVALVGLVHALRQVGVVLFDVQWRTDHLATLGVCNITRSDYLARLAAATATAADSLAALTKVNSLLGAIGSLDLVR